MIRVLITYKDKLQQDCVAFEDDLQAQAYAIQCQSRPDVYGVKILGNNK